MVALQQVVIREGPTKVEATHTQGYILAIRNLPIKSLEEVSDQVLASQFSKLLLALKSLKPSKDPKDIIKTLFQVKNGHYRGMEMILHGIAVAAISFSVESVLESVHSKFHNGKSICKQIDKPFVKTIVLINCQ